MSGNHPAEIAKYLLKGWCLLNEYCPNGHNIPLVRSRENKIVCVCGDQSCPYSAAGEGGGKSTPLTPAPVQPRELDVTPVSAAAQTRGVQQDTHTPSGKQFLASPALSVPDTGLAASYGPSEVSFTCPECRFSCVRLDLRSDGVPRLLGESYGAKVCVGTSDSLSDVASSLQDVLRKVCSPLMDHMLIPQKCSGVDIARDMGKVIVKCRDGAEFVLPERECVFLAGVSLESIAKLILEGVCAEKIASRVDWLEVSLSSSIGEVSCRRVLAG
mmetsp:Transcript_140944/g.270465  ORF Transcript_140944/g.270465 Transcript_140944/m.270465 type:complete len:271 (-) Transcript_140944:155-967(-)